MSSGRIPPEEVLAACERAGMVSEPVTASEVAEELECSRRAALNKLDELAERGDIETKKVGARSRVWWRPPRHLSTREQDETDDASETASVTVRGSLSETRKHLNSELGEVFGRISDGFYALDNQWQFTYVSERAEELIDAQGIDLVGKNIWKEFDDVADSKLSEEYRTAMETQKPTSFEFYDELLTAWYEVYVYPSETGLSVYFQDISDRKQRERQLEKSERRYRSLVENFPNGAVALVDENLHYQTVGGSPIPDSTTTDELESQPVREVLPSKLADDLVPRYEAAFEGERSTVESKIDDRIYQIRTVPVRDDDGDVFAALGMSQNITAYKENQRELEERNERLDSFASMLAHELRNPVTIGQIYTQQLPEETESDAVEYVSEAFDRIEDMIDVMLVLTRGREAVGKQTPTRLVDVAQEAWDEVEASDATLSLNFDYTIPGDKTYIRHLFRNLFENAVKHGGRDVTITVDELPTGFYVADDGPGIPIDDRAAVFDPGFTTAAGEGGTGLGLAFVEKLAEVYEWEPTVTESTAGGAQFEFTNVVSDSSGD